jgi:hypothetical protein
MGWRHSGFVVGVLHGRGPNRWLDALATEPETGRTRALRESACGRRGTWPQRA